MSSGCGSAREVTVPGALRLAGAELPCATKLRVLTLSPAAVKGQDRGGNLRQGPDCQVGRPWPGGLHPPMAPKAWPRCPVSCHRAFARPGNGRGAGWVARAVPPCPVLLCLPSCPASLRAAAPWSGRACGPSQGTEGISASHKASCQAQAHAGCVCPPQPSAGAAQLLTEELVNPHKSHGKAEVKWDPGVPLPQPGRWPRDVPAAEAGSWGESLLSAPGTCLVRRAPCAPAGRL